MRVEQVCRRCLHLKSAERLTLYRQIALHVASSYGGAQFYLSCAQINVENGGSGTPSPLVSIPGVYTGVRAIIRSVKTLLTDLSNGTVRARHSHRHLRPSIQLHRLPSS